MAFDPTKPVENTQLDAPLMRSQLNALKELNDALTVRVAALEAQMANKANLPTMEAFDQSISDPPTQSDVQKVVDWQNEVLSELNGTDA